MTWDEVLEVEPEVRAICKKWASVYAPDLYEDAVHHVFIKMVESVNLKLADDKRKYINSSVNNILWFFFDLKNKGRKPISLDYLEECGIQVDEDGDLIWPGSEDSYTGNYNE